MADRPTAPIALLAPRRPPWARVQPSEVVWCETASELAVLARRGQLRAAVIDALLAGLDAELVGLVRRSCPVLVIDRGTAERWSAAGASVVPLMPPDEASLLAVVEAAEAAAATWMPGAERSGQRGALITVLAAPGGDGTAGATATASSLAARGAPGPVVLADLTLDAPHRALHGLTPDRPGLPDLIEAGRFGPPGQQPTIPLRHPTGRGYLLVPGLLHHHDWVIVGEHAAASALDAIRIGAALVVAHVDRDLEGETDTGSFDIEDRNVLARTAVRASDLVLVAAGSDRSRRLGVIVALGALARFGVAQDRIVVVRSGGRGRPITRRRQLTTPQVLQLRRGERPDPRLGAAIRTRLAATGPVDRSRSSDGHGPQAIVPGTLGTWTQDTDGWITPRAPQQP